MLLKGFLEKNDLKCHKKGILFVKIIVSYYNDDFRIINASHNDISKK